MRSNPSEHKGDDALPVDVVSWEDIQRFEAKTGLRLPTEAEWEYACRGGATAALAGKQIEDLGWFRANSESWTHPAGQRAPNGFGLHDLPGNVREWCEDIYDAGFYGKPEAAGRDPVCRTGSAYRVIRGGCFGDEARIGRSSLRLRDVADDQCEGQGFRAAFGPLP